MIFWQFVWRDKSKGRHLGSNMSGIKNFTTVESLCCARKNRLNGRTDGAVTTILNPGRSAKSCAAAIPNVELLPRPLSLQLNQRTLSSRPDTTFDRLNSNILAAQIDLVDGLLPMRFCGAES
ncbi:hypothetical protein OH492_13035 [Vibrio chagasii]|nr:hypothetical protein [Vibrio chagasii]